MLEVYLSVPVLRHIPVCETCQKCLFCGVMADCVISFIDLDGVRHSVEVQADGLYEAAILGIVAFKKHNTELEVEVRSTITHTLTVRKAHEWLERGVRTPKEAVIKERLRAML